MERGRMLDSNKYRNLERGLECVAMCVAYSIPFRMILQKKIFFHRTFPACGVFSTC